jgi:hypothetical protein
VLLFAVIGRVVRIDFDGVVERLEPLQEFIAIESAAGKRAYYLFDFLCNYVALAEIGIVEDLAEDAFGEQVLDKHTLDGIFGEIRINGLLAESVEIGEGAGERGAFQALVFDQLLDALRILWNAIRKFVDSMQPFFDVRHFVNEELVDDGDQRLGARNVLVEDARAPLIENGALGRLEDGVVGRIAFVEFALDFSKQIVFFVFGFPVAVREVARVEKCPVDADESLCALDRVFGNEC